MSHRARGALIAGIGTIALGVLMFLPRTLSCGVGLGIVLVFAVLVGLLDMLGALRFERPEEPPKPAKPAKAAKRAKPAKAAKQIRVEAPAAFDLANASLPVRLAAKFDVRILWLGIALCAAAACRISVIGTMAAAAPWSGPVLAVAGGALILVARLRGRKRPFDGDLHEGFLVLALATATIMATLGSQGLWDCWETHYGEVARRQLEQDDWISLWWESEWFYSKPILIFWMMNLGMALFGVRVTPDEVSAHAEWGVRFFVGVLAIAVLWGVYQLLARRVSRRAGLFAAVILGTMPLYAFMARQAITDLPFVGLMALAFVLFLLGITADPGAEVRPIRVPLPGGRRLPLSGFHAVVAGLVVTAVPQFVYLATRSAIFRSGTLGRGDLRNVKAQHVLLDGKLSDFVSSVFGTPVGGVVDISLGWFLLGIAYAVPFVIILYTLRRERRVSRLCFHGTYLALALSVMAKGLPGLAMPILGLIGLWLDRAPWSGRHREEGSPSFASWHLAAARRLDLGRGIPMFLLVASPWYLAMFLRHGMAFINRFFIHDHLRRLSEGVHGDVGTFLYYAKQLGFAAFPWIGLLPFALFAWTRLRPAAAEGAGAEADAAVRWRRTIAIFCSSLFVFGFALFAAMVTKYHHYILPLLPAAAILIALYLDDLWMGRARAVGAVVILAVASIALVVRDLAQPIGDGVLQGYAQLIGLFIYKYSRPYPAGPEYDISKEIIVFGAVFAVGMGLWLIARCRRAAIALTMVAALVFGHWLTQHHMVALAPQWTQKHIVEEYYARRRSAAERLVAFQMNWKGENFYTGNRVVVHVSTKNKNFEAWVDKHRGERHFFITEESRFKRMSQRAAAASGPLEHIPNDRNNKYEAGWADEL
jgi:4-amino-4-deoxy-L-arabinose transferase-like glycosyltransferase